MSKAKFTTLQLKRNSYVEKILKKSQKLESRNKMNLTQINWRFDNTESILGINFRCFLQLKYAFVIRRGDGTFALISLGKQKKSSVRIFNIIDMEAFIDKCPIKILDYWDDSKALYDSLDVIKEVNPNGYIDIIDNTISVYELV